MIAPSDIGVALLVFVMKVLVLDTIDIDIVFFLIKVVDGVVAGAFLIEDEVILALTPIKVVIALAAVEPVVALAAVQVILAVVAPQLVVAIVAVEPVVVLAAVQFVVALAAVKVVIPLVAVQVSSIPPFLFVLFQ